VDWKEVEGKWVGEKEKKNPWEVNVATYPILLNSCITTSRGNLEVTVRGI
jgi:hypothetical protein